MFLLHAFPAVHPLGAKRGKNKQTRFFRAALGLPGGAAERGAEAPGLAMGRTPEPAARLPLAARERLLLGPRQDGAETREARRPEGGSGEGIRRGLADCGVGGKATRPGARRGARQGSPGRRGEGRREPAGPQARSSSRTKAGVSEEENAGCGGRAAEKSSLPLLRGPLLAVDFCPQTSARACGWQRLPGSRHPTETCRPRFSPSFLNWGPSPPGPGLRGAALSGSPQNFSTASPSALRAHALKSGLDAEE